MSCRHATLVLVLVLLFFFTFLSNAVLVPFPPNFYVTIGTTIPFPSATPVAQSGSIYVSSETKQVRIDNFFLGSQYSFVADTRQRRGYIIENHPPGSLGQDGDEKGRNSCKTFKINTDVNIFGVPDEFVRDAEPHLVRGVRVTRYAGFDRDAGGPLQHVDYYIHNITFRVSGENPREFIFTVPWRVQTHRRQQEIKELTGAPSFVPNWRYFGGPFFDEVAIMHEPLATSLERVMDDTTVTVDFYNFVPIAPDPSVFATPSDCKNVEEEIPKNTNVDISLAQRLLVDLSFSSLAGRRILSQNAQPSV